MELYHHGVKGQKWGVRHYQNEDGSYKHGAEGRYYDEVGTKSKNNKNVNQSDTKKSLKNHSSSTDNSALAKKLADKDWDSVKNMEDPWDEYNRKVEEYSNKIKPKKMKDFRGRWTKEADEYYDKMGEFQDKANKEAHKKDNEIYKKIRNEEEKLIKKVYLNENTKKDILEADKINQKRNAIEKETLSENSKAFKDAYKDYLKKTNQKDDDNAYYGFEHYIWKSGNQAYDKAKKEYTERSAELSKAYEKKIESISKSIFKDYSDVKINNGMFNTYADYGKHEIDNIINFKQHLLHPERLVKNQRSKQ